MADAESYATSSWKPRYNPWIIALTVTLATFMEVLDSSIANVALLHIAGGLSAGQNESTRTRILGVWHGGGGRTRHWSNARRLDHRQL